MATIKDVAALAGISYTTVSHVLNKTRPVSEQVRQKVEAAIVELDYVPSAVARSLKARSTATIGLLVPSSVNPYFAELARGIEDACERNGYCVILCNSDDNPQKQRSYLRVLLEKRIDGLVVASVGEDSDLLQSLAGVRTPMVIVDRELEGVDAFGRDSGLAIIPAPRLLPRVIRVPEEVGGPGANYVFLSSMIHAHADDLFQGMKVKGCYQFRLTRNADLALDSEEVDDLARALRGELFSRRYGDAVRLEVADTCPKHLSDYLLKQFSLSESELYQVNGPVNLTRLFSITGLDSHPELQYTPFTPAIPKLLQNADNIFSVIGKQDILLMHPFESFTPVIDLLRQAAKDPHVLAVRQTLYRSGANSEIVDALVDAARNGKEVTAVIELRARFDEESNLQMASRLQAAGAVVIYGVVGFKTHAKMMLILRREHGEIVRYAHLGTGNYHAGNARLYTDYSLLTSDDALTEDVGKLFSQLIGMGKTLRMKKLLHAPFTLKKGMLDMIARETQFALDGKPAHIIAKFNSLTDAKVIKALYKASQSGVKIDLVVRGMCCLRPGIPGVSHNIQVRSIIGRFLEHTRVFYFLNGGEEQIYLSSADWMERNLDKRVETCFPVEGKKLLLRVKKELEGYLTDNTHAWTLQPDGRYVRSTPTGNQNPRSVQATLLERLSNPVLNVR